MQYVWGTYSSKMRYIIVYKVDHGLGGMVWLGRDAR